MQDEPDPRFVEISDGPRGVGADDVVDHRPRSVVDRLGQRRMLAGLLIATLAVGIGVGFFSGRHAARSGAPATTTVVRSVTPSSGPFDQVISTGARCSAQIGHQLQLGVEVRNELTVPVKLIDARTALPMGGFRLTGTVRGACGMLPGADDTIDGYELAVGAAVWLTVRLEVLVACPTPLPVQISLRYVQAGHNETAIVGGFPDLGGVPYSGCRS
jgi:hypothetical protein